MTDLPVCGACGGRGWVLHGIAGADWPLRCEPCRGRGWIAPLAWLYAIAKAIGERPATVRRLDEMRVRPATAARILDKIAAFA